MAQPDFAALSAVSQTLYVLPMKPKAKKVLNIVLAVTSVCIASYLVFVGYLVTNGYRDYVGFCSKYLSQIDEYKSKNRRYPDSLMELNKPKFSFRYGIQDCSYYSQENMYGFTAPSGLIGLAFYDSKTKKWTYD